MSGKVIGIETARPHLSGPARCLDCKHEFVAVAPVGTYCMTCPSCGADKAARFSMIDPPTDVWVCNCGNQFMLILFGGQVFCPNCGLHHDPG